MQFLKERIPGIILLALSISIYYLGLDEVHRFPGARLWAEYLTIGLGGVLISAMGSTGIAVGIWGNDV